VKLESKKAGTPSLSSCELVFQGLQLWDDRNIELGLRDIISSKITCQKMDQRKKKTSKKHGQLSLISVAKASAKEWTNFLSSTG